MSAGLLHPVIVGVVFAPSSAGSFGKRAIRRSAFIGVGLSVRVMGHFLAVMPFQAVRA